MDNRDQLLLGMGRLEGKVDALLALGHERRISSLERARAWLVGAGFVAGGLSSFVIHLFSR